MKRILALLAFLPIAAVADTWTPATGSTAILPSSQKYIYSFTTGENGGSTPTLNQCRSLAIEFDNATGGAGTVEGCSDGSCTASVTIATLTDTMSPGPYTSAMPYLRINRDDPTAGTAQVFIRCADNLARGGAGVTDGDKGDITVSGGGSTYTVDANSVALGTDTTGGYAGSATEGGTATAALVADGGSSTLPIIREDTSDRCWYEDHSRDGARATDGSEPCVVPQADQTWFSGDKRRHVQHPEDGWSQGTTTTDGLNEVIAYLKATPGGGHIVLGPRPYRLTGSDSVLADGAAGQEIKITGAGIGASIIRCRAAEGCTATRVMRNTGSFFTLEDVSLHHEAGGDVLENGDATSSYPRFMRLTRVQLLGDSGLSAGSRTGVGLRNHGLVTVVRDAMIKWVGTAILLDADAGGRVNDFTLEGSDLTLSDAGLDTSVGGFVANVPDTSGLRIVANTIETIYSFCIRLRAGSSGSDAWLNSATIADNRCESADTGVYLEGQSTSYDPSAIIVRNQFNSLADSAWDGDALAAGIYSESDYDGQITAYGNRMASGGNCMIHGGTVPVLWGANSHTASPCVPTSDGTTPLAAGMLRDILNDLAWRDEAVTITGAWDFSGNLLTTTDIDESTLTVVPSATDASELDDGTRPNIDSVSTTTCPSGWFYDVGRDAAFTFGTDRCVTADHIVYAQDYRNNGTTTTAGIQEAVTAACASFPSSPYGGLVVIPDGNISTTGTVTISCEWITLQGNGLGSRWIPAAGTTALIVAEDQITLRDFVIDFTVSNAANIGINGDSGVTGPSGLRLQGVVLRGQTETGIGLRCDACLKTSVTDSIIQDWNQGTFWTGAVGTSYPNANSITNSVISANANEAVYIEDAHSTFTISGSTFESNTIGVRCDTITNGYAVLNSISNHYEDNSVAGIYRPDLGCPVNSFGDRFSDSNLVDYHSVDVTNTKPTTFYGTQFSDGGMTNATGVAARVVWPVHENGLSCTGPTGACQIWDETTLGHLGQAATITGAWDASGGSLTVPTAAANDNDTSSASTAFVQQEIDDVDLLSDNCVLENDATPIPDSCVGNGTDDTGAGGGDAIRVEDGDNAGTFTAMTDADLEDSGDINFVRAAGTPDAVSAEIRTGAVGTNEAAALDAGDITTGELPDARVSDTLTASTSTTAAANDNDTSIATTAFVQQEIDDGDFLTDNCVLENDGTPIPDSCVGDGTDGGGALPVVDTTSIAEGSADNTKEVRFEVDGITTGTVRVLTMADANVDLANTDADFVAGDVTDDDDLDVSAGGTGASSFTSNAVLKGAGTGDLVASGVTIDGSNNVDGIGTLDADGSVTAPSFVSDPTALPEIRFEDSNAPADADNDNDAAILIADMTDVTANSTDSKLEISVQVNDVVTEIAQIDGTGVTVGGVVIVDATDPADSGAVRLDNNEGVAWEASPAGTDVVMAADASEIVQITGGTLDAGDLSGTVPDTSVDGSLESDEVTGLTDAQISDTLTASASTTAAANDNDTSIATTAFVQQEIDDGDLLTDNCVLENDSTPIPDSCVGDGTDASGGTTAIDALDNAGAGDDSVTLAEQGQTWTWDTAATAGAFDALSLTITDDSTAGATTQRGLVVERNDSTGTATVETLVQVNNNDTDGVVTTGIEVTAAAGTIGTAIDVSDAEIGTALAVGSNDVTVNAVTVSASEFGALDNGIDLSTSETAGTLPLSKLADDAALAKCLVSGGGGSDPSYTDCFGLLLYDNAAATNPYVSYVSGSIRLDNNADGSQDWIFNSSGGLDHSGNLIPLVDFLGLDSSAAPAPTVDGAMAWENDDDHIVVGDGAASVEFVPAEDVSGDATMDDAGVVTVANNSHDHDSTTLSTDSVSADELNATGVEAELETELDIAGEVTSTGMASTVIADSLTVDLWTLGSPTFTTLADFPTVTAFPGTPPTGAVVIVTDDSAIGACDSAAGSARSLCWYNGSAWQSLGDGGGGGFTSFNADGDNNSPQTITDGNELLIAGGTNGIDTTASATDTVTIDLDWTEVAANTIDTSKLATEVRTFNWGAASMIGGQAGGTALECDADPYKTSMGGSGGPVQYGFACPLGGTNLDGALYGMTIMPDSWDAGSLVFQVAARIADDPGATETLQGVINAQCVSDEDAPSTTWTANQGLDVTFVAGDVQWDTQHVVASAITPDGTCAAGDALFWRYVVCDTGTPPTTGCSASTHDVTNTLILNMTMEYTSNVGD